MTGTPAAGPPPPGPTGADGGGDTLAVLAGVPLSPEEAGYVAAARAANTLRGYRSDCAELGAWAARQGLGVLPAGPATVGLRAS